MNPEQMREFYEANFYYILAADVGIGLLLGAVPLVLGIRRKKRNMGIAGFILAGICGGITPIISLLVAAVFTILILRKPRIETAAETSYEEPSSE